MSVKINNTSINNTANSAANIKNSNGTTLGTNPTGSSFQSIIKGVRLEEFNGTMNELLNIVRDRGQAFLRSPQEDSLNNYKESVKYFLNRIREEFLSLREEFGAERNGEQRVYQLVDTAGNQADALTQEAFNKDDALGLLANLDDIRGMVIDIIG